MMEPEYLDKLPPDYQEAFRKSFIRSVAILVTVIIGMAICALFSSCTTTKYVEKQVHDTLYQAVHDSIPQPYPVIKEVPAELTWWQHFRISLANILLWVVGIVAVVTLVRWWLKQKKVI